MSLSTGSTGSAVTGRQQFFEAAPDVLAIASFDGRLQDCNPAFTESLGWSLGELRGQSLLDLVHFGDRESTAAELAKLRQGAASVSFENRCRTHDGGFRRFAWAVSLAERQLFAVGREIVEFSLATRRSSTPASLTENDLLTNRVVYEGNPHSGELRYTEHIASLLGCDQSELSHGRWRELIHPDDRASYDQAIRENLARKRPFHLDYHLVRKDGTVIAVQDVGQFRFDADLNVTRVVGYVTPAVGWGSPTELERVTTYYRGLAECAVALNSTRSLNDIHQLITDQARSIIGAHQSVTSITVGADLAQAVNALSLSDKYAPWRSYSVVPDGSGIYAMICETNRTARMTQEQLESHPRWRGFGKERHAHPPMRGWLAAPLIGRDGKNLGLIQLSDKYEGEFDETDEAMLVQLAKMASVAIENARLYRDIEAARENLEEKVRE